MIKTNLKTKINHLLPETFMLKPYDDYNTEINFYNYLLKNVDNVYKKIYKNTYNPWYINEECFKTCWSYYYMVFLNKICRINNIDDVFYLNLEHKTNRHIFKNNNFNKQLTSKLNFSLLVDENIHGLIYNNSSLENYNKEFKFDPLFIHCNFKFKNYKLNKLNEIRYQYNNSDNNRFSIFSNSNNNNYPHIPCLQNDDEINSKLENNFKKLKAIDKIKINLFSYQKKNIVWMNYVENSIDNNNYTFKNHNAKNNNIIFNFVKKYKKSVFNEYFSKNIMRLYYESGYEKYYFCTFIRDRLFKTQKFVDFNKITSHNLLYNKLDNNNYILQKNKKYYLLDSENLNNEMSYDIPLSGGIICDDVGLGKTLSIISHLVCNLEKDNNNNSKYDLNNLIIVPPGLLRQWKFEIEKYVGTKYFNIHTIASITDVKKMYKTTKNTKTSNSEKLTKSTDNNIESKTDSETKSKSNNTTKKDTKKDIKKYDIYIMSHNILNNSNYFKYVQENYEKFKGSSDRYNINEYFDVFRIKWNRIIVDEIHELVYNFNNEWAKNSSNTKQNRLITINIMFNLNSNYRWGLSATPLIKLHSNLSGYICFLSNIFKTEYFRKANNINEIKFYDFLYKKKGIGMEDDSDYTYYCTRNNVIMHLLDENNIFYSNCLDILNQFTDNELELIQKKIFIKTSKNLVRSEINIPIFTEEIKYIELSNIEKNIYNNAKTDNSYSYYNRQEKIKRMFQLCTNICISDKDLLNMGFDSNKVISLEELNKGMIESFKKQLNKKTKELKDNEFKLNNMSLIKNNSNQILDYINKSLNIISMYNKADLNELDNIFKISFFNTTNNYNRYRYYPNNEHNNVECIEQKRYIKSLNHYLKKYLYEITISDLFSNISYFNNIYFSKLHNMNMNNEHITKSITNVASIIVIKNNSIENKPNDNSIENKPNIDSVENKPNIDSVENKTNIDSVENKTNIDSVENKPNDNSVENKPNIDSVENIPNDNYIENKNTITNTNTLNVQNIKPSNTIEPKLENSDNTKDDENKLTVSSMFSDNDVFYIISKTNC